MPYRIGLENGMASKRSAGDVLVELLDKVPDAKTLEILLDAPNLVKLLQANGFDTEQVRRDLKSGKLPGELLLDLLAKEPDTAKLLAQLGSPAPASSPVSVPAADGSGGGSDLRSRVSDALNTVRQQAEVERAKNRAAFLAAGPRSPAVKKRARLMGVMFIVLGVVLTVIAVAWLSISTGRIFKLEIALLVAGPVFILLGLAQVITGRLFIGG